MQVQKEAVRQAILSAAKNEFHFHGYKKASMRQIALAAQITPGNIYAYFPSKNELFAAVVGPAAEEMRRISSLDFPGEQLSLNLILNALLTLFLQRRTEFFILINCGEESPFANCRKEITAAASKSIATYVFPHLPEAARDSQLADAWAAAVVEGMRTLLLADQSEEAELRRRLDLYLHCLFPPEVMREWIG